MKRAILFGLCALLTPVVAFAQVGDFPEQASVGDDGGLGAAEFSDGTYIIEAGGSDIWGGADGFYWVYQEYTGNFVVTADIAWNEDRAIRTNDVNDWRKAGIMARVEPTEPGSRAVMGLLRSDLGSNLQWRPEAGSETLQVGLTAKETSDTDTLRLIRVGNEFSLLRGQEDGSFRTIGSAEVDLPETLYLGLAVTSHDTQNIEAGEFSNLQIDEIPVAVQASRTIPDDSFTPGAPVEDITLELIVEEGETADLVVNEVIPAGWELLDSDPAASQDGNNLTWELSGASGTVTVTYSLRSPAGANEGALFSGSITAGEMDFGVSGDSQIDLEGADMAYAPLLEQSAELDGEISEGEYDGAYTFMFDRANERAPGVLLDGPAYPVEESHATVHVFHNADFIFVGIDVVDPALSFDANGNPWEDDSIELYMDGDMSESNPKDGNNFGFQATVQGDGTRTAGNDPPPTTEELDNGGIHSTDGLYWNFSARVKDDESGYVIEYQVDKFQILDPLDRTEIGFDIGINDNDGTSGRLGKWAWWHFDVDTGGRKDAWNDERGWGVLQLLETAELPGVDQWSLY